MKRAMAGGIVGLALALAGGAGAEERGASRGAFGGGMVEVAVPQAPKPGGAVMGGGAGLEAEQRFDGKLGWGAMKGYIDGPPISESAPFLPFWKGEPPKAPAAARAAAPAQAATGQPGCGATASATGASSGRCTR